MKKLYHPSFMLLALFVVSCTENPLETIEGNNWQKERNIISILVEGQVGTAVIERNLDDAKVKIFAKEANIADMSKVEIKSIELSYGATTANSAGTTLDFSNGVSTISIVSGAGETLNWEITLLPFVSDLEGAWYISEIGLYADMWTWEIWGWEKYEKINNYLPELSPELDNVLTFTVNGADENGNPFGSYEHSPGNDGLYGNFGDEDQGWDFNERFRKIPTETGTWSRDFERNKVMITDENKVVHELDLELFTETEEVSLKTDLLYQPELFDWDVQAWSYEELAHMSKKMWYNLSK